MKRNAILGGLVWCALLAAAHWNKTNLGWIELLFLFAPLVILPLGLELTARADAAVGAPSLERIVHVPAALLAVSSFAFPCGAVAAALACGWLAFCILLALAGVTRFAKGAFRSLERICAAVAFAYLAIGGVWLVASRLGLSPMGFQEPIVLLTAVHFHYAGFAAPLLARSTVRAFPQRFESGGIAAAIRVVVVVVLLGPGFLATGFVVGPRLKLFAALLLAVGEVGLAILFFAALRHVERLSARLLIVIAAASLIYSMLLAALWAIGEYPMQPFVHLAEMARLHGTANAFGFTLCGLLGWIAASARKSENGSASQ